MRPRTQASIRTRYVGPTNYRPSRITVADDGAFGNKPRRLTWTCPAGAGVAESHAAAAQACHAAAAQAWLDKYNPGNVVKGPGLGFAHEYYWTWEDGRFSWNPARRPRK